MWWRRRFDHTKRIYSSRRVFWAIIACIITWVFFSVAISKKTATCWIFLFNFLTRFAENLTFVLCSQSISEVFCKVWCLLELVLDYFLAFKNGDRLLPENIFWFYRKFTGDWIILRRQNIQNWIWFWYEVEFL